MADLLPIVRICKDTGTPFCYKINPPADRFILSAGGLILRQENPLNNFDVY